MSTQATPYKSKRRKNMIALLVALLALCAAGVQIVRHSDFLAGYVPRWTRNATPNPQATEPTVQLIDRPQRPTYPARPRVALLAFDVNHDSYRASIHLASLTELAQALCVEAEDFEWVLREDLEPMTKELEYGLAYGNRLDSTQPQAGLWARCDLLIAGQVIDVGKDDQRIRIDVIDANTADRVATRIEPFPADLIVGEPDESQAGSLSALILEALEEAHAKMLDHRDATVVSLLFFRNASKNDRLEHLNLTLPDYLQSLAEAQKSLRLVRTDDPLVALSEQELLQLGMLDADPDAWASAADYYMWGLAEERQLTSSTEESVERMDPEDVPTRVSVYLWHGLGEPVEFTETVPAREIEAAAKRVAERAWERARDPVPATLSLESRDRVVQLLTRPQPGRGRSYSYEAGTPVDNWESRQFFYWLHAYRAGYFLKPTDLNLAYQSFFYVDMNDPEQAWRQYSRSLDNLYRATRLVQLSGSRFSPGWDYENILELQIDVIDAMIKSVYKKRARYYGGARGVGGLNYRYPTVRGMLHPPDDMPPEIRQKIVGGLMDRAAALGTVASEAWTRHVAQSPQRKGPPSRATQIDLVSELMDLIFEHDVTSAESRLAVWDAWWPLIEPHWLEEMSESPKRRFHFDEDLIPDIKVMMTEAGQPERFVALMKTDTLSAAITQTPTKTGEPQLEAAMRRVTELRAQGVLAEPESPKPITDFTQPGDLTEQRRPSSHLLEILKANDVPPEMKKRLEDSLRRNAARYGDTQIAGHPIPKHSDAPLVEPAMVALPWQAKTNEVITADPRTQFHRFGRAIWYGHWLGIVTDRAGAHRGDSFSYASDELWTFHPRRLQFSYPSLEWPRDLQINDVEALDNEVWLATDDLGLMAVDLNTMEQRAFDGSDGLMSQSIDFIRRVGTDLLIANRNGRVALVEKPTAEQPRFVDLLLPEAVGKIQDVWSAGRTAMILGSDRAWLLNVETGQTQDLEGWLADRIDSIVDRPISYHAQDGAFFIVLPDRLIRTSADLSQHETWPMPVPPLDGLLLHEDEDILWIAYSWQIPVPPSLRGNLKAHKRSRLIAFNTKHGATLGQMELDGEVQVITSGFGELYVIGPGLTHDIRIYHRQRLLEALGATDIDPWPEHHDRGGEQAHAGWANEISWRAYRGETDTVRRLLEEGQDPNTRIEHGWSPLMAAVRGGHADTTSVLLEAGADPVPRTVWSFAYTPITLATMWNRPDLLQLLADQGGDLTFNSRLVGLPAHAAVLNRSHDALRWLGEHGTRLHYFVPTQERLFWGPGRPRRLSWRSPMDLAVGFGDLTAVDILLDAGINPSQSRDVPRSYVPPISTAVREGHDAIIERLLEAGVDPDEPDSGRQTPLAHALYFGKYEMVDRLLEAGADPAKTPILLITAAKVGNEKWTRRTIEAGVDPNIILDGTNWHFRSGSSLGVSHAAVSAAGFGQYGLLSLLIEDYAIDLDITLEDERLGDIILRQLLHRRAYGHALPLIKQGYAVDHPYDFDGKTLLMKTVQRGRLAEAEILLLLGADPDRRDDRDVSAREMAKSDAMRALLYASANPSHEE